MRKSSLFPSLVAALAATASIDDFAPHRDPASTNGRAPGAHKAAHRAAMKSRRVKAHRARARG